MIPVETAFWFVEPLIRAFKRPGFKAARREAFYLDMAAFLEAGIAPYAAMERMRDVAKPRRRMRSIYRLLRDVLQRMTHGASLAAALKPFIPAEEFVLLLAGERGGRTVQALTELASLLERRRIMGSALRSHLIPSGVMLLILIGIMVYILKVVLSDARGMVPPEIMQKLMIAPYYFAAGDWFLQAIPYLAACAIAFAMAVSVSLPRWKPDRARKWLDHHLPPYSMYTRIQSSYFLTTAAAMMEAGVPFTQAVQDIKKNSNPWVKAHATRMLVRIASGRGESEAMQTGLLPWDVEDRLAIYKMLDDLKSIMQRMAKDSMEILLKRVTLLGATVRNVVMVLLAAFILATVGSIGEIAMSAQSSAGAS